MPPGYVLDYDLSEPPPSVAGPARAPAPQAPVDFDDFSGPATQFAPSMDDDFEFERLNDPEFDPPVHDDGEHHGAAASQADGARGTPDAPPALATGPLPLLRASADDIPAEYAPVDVALPEPEHDEPEFVRLGRAKEQVARRRRLTMGAGSALLMLVLLVQGITTYRNIIAAKYPALKPALVAGCALLRCKVELPAQIESLAIETGELQTISTNTFQYTTLLRNESGLTQAWPYIELELIDSNDKPLVRRVFTPPQYLPQGVAPAKGFGAHSEQPVKIHFELKQLKASGFHIAVFYP